MTELICIVKTRTKNIWSGVSQGLHWWVVKCKGENVFRKTRVYGSLLHLVEASTQCRKKDTLLWPGSQMYTSKNQIQTSIGQFYFLRDIDEASHYYTQCQKRLILWPHHINFMHTLLNTVTESHGFGPDWFTRGISESLLGFSMPLEGQICLELRCSSFDI